MRKIFISIVFLLIGGCSPLNLLRGRPAEDAGFLPFSTLLKPMPERGPFNAAYVPNINKLDQLKLSYTKVMIEPVDIQIAISKIKKRKLPNFIEEELISDVKELSIYFLAKIKAAFTATKYRKYELVDTPDSQTFIWQIALVEVTPNSPELSVLSTIASFFIPGTGTLRVFGSGSVAMEGIVRDGSTGEVLALFKDRRVDKTAPVSVRDYQRYAHTRTNLDNWADNFAELAGTPSTHKVEEDLPFTLDPL
jgi:hypothetical protein